jgi:hypothetical protein
VNANLHFQKLIKATCLSSTGRSRLELPQQKVVFSYESLLSPQSKTWKVVAEIPLMGQELVEFNWSQGMKVKTSGAKSKIDNHVLAQLNSLEKFLNIFAKPESWNCTKSNNELNCRNGQEKITLELVENGYQINLLDWKISVNQLNQQNFFEKIVLQGQNDSTSWHFFVSSCQ